MRVRSEMVQSWNHVPVLHSDRRGPRDTGDQRGKFKGAVRNYTTQCYKVQAKEVPERACQPSCPRSHTEDKDCVGATDHQPAAFGLHAEVLTEPDNTGLWRVRR